MFRVCDAIISFACQSLFAKLYNLMRRIPLILHFSFCILHSADFLSIFTKKIYTIICLFSNKTIEILKFM